MARKHTRFAHQAERELLRHPTGIEGQIHGLIHVRRDDPEVEAGLGEQAMAARGRFGSAGRWIGGSGRGLGALVAEFVVLWELWELVELRGPSIRIRLPLL